MWPWSYRKLEDRIRVLEERGLKESIDRALEEYKQCGGTAPFIAGGGVLWSPTGRSCSLEQFRDLVLAPLKAEIEKYPALVGKNQGSMPKCSVEYTWSEDAAEATAFLRTSTKPKKKRIR